ncbi:MAG TPA: acyltransferase, partial [Actinomycetota bacterium]
MDGRSVSVRRVAPERGVRPSTGPAGGADLAVQPPLVGERLAYLDNLKTLLIAGIIASHAVMGYATFGSWTYQDVQEVTLSDVAEKIYAILVLVLGGLFLMALFFLISGLLTEGSLVRKGSSRFVSDRLLRLGVPLAVYTLVVWPLLEYALFGPFLHVGFWRSVTNTDPVLDNGPMWFVGVLLLFSVALAWWRRVFPPPRPPEGSLRLRHLVVLALAVGVASFAVRIVLPVDSNQPLNLKLWGWPEYLAMFGLGIAAARRGWLRPVPRALARRCGTATLISTLAIVVVAVTTDLRGLEQDEYFGGWGLLALVWAMAEGVLAVSGPIWVLAFVQRHLNGSGRLRRAMARGSYAAFMVQGPVLVALALALRPVALPGDVKALVVASLGIVGSFALAWPL